MPILRELPPEALDQLLGRCEVTCFPAGATILERGTLNDAIHFLLDGQAHIHFDLADLSRPIEVPAGQLFGEVSVIDELPTSAYVLAGVPCRVLRIPAALFWSDVAGAPGAARAVMRQLSDRLRDNAVALTDALHDRLRHEALGRELALAREVQMGMLRRADPWFPGEDRIAIATYLEPARLVGGDFYDVFRLDPDHLAVAIGDVAGKGISAALFMVRALTLLRSVAPYWVSLPKTVGAVNNALAADNDAAMFLTLFMAVLDLRTGEVEYINYGHAPPLLLGAEGGAVLHRVGSGLVFGMLDGARGAIGRLTLPPGGTLLLYSDGVTEAPDPVGRMFGNAGLVTAATGPASTLVARVTAAVRAHAGGTGQDDDITLLSMTWRGAGNGAARED